MRWCRNCAERKKPIKFECTHPCVDCQGERVTLNGSNWRTDGSDPTAAAAIDDLLPVSGRIGRSRERYRSIVRSRARLLSYGAMRSGLQVEFQNALFSASFSHGLTQQHYQQNKENCIFDLAATMFAYFEVKR